MSEENPDYSFKEKVEAGLATKRSDVMAVRLVGETYQDEVRTGTTERAKI